MVVVGDNSRSNTKIGNKGAVSCQGILVLLLLGLVFTHGKYLLQDFLDIFIHLALENSHRRYALELHLHHDTFSPGERDGWGSAFCLLPPTPRVQNASIVNSHISIMSQREFPDFPLGDD